MRKEEREKGGYVRKMAKNISKVKEIDVAAVEGNMTLAAGLDRRAVERCKDAIEKLGVIHTPVVGTTQSGNRRILSGQCELTALRELGIRKMDAIEVDVTNEAGIIAKLSLLLISLKDRPGALCEGLLLQEAVGAGVPRSEIQSMLGKSASWVSNRISLVTRLDDGVYEMVRGGLLDPRSAQEVARLPPEVQFEFAQTVLHEGLPKSAVDSLVGAYNDESCPEAVRAQIIGDPRAALRRMTGRRRAVNEDQKGRSRGHVPPHDIDRCIKSVIEHMGRLCHMLPYVKPQETPRYSVALAELESEVLTLLAVVRAFVSPGKTEVGCNGG